MSFARLAVTDVCTAQLEKLSVHTRPQNQLTCNTPAGLNVRCSEITHNITEKVTASQNDASKGNIAWSSQA